MHEELGAQTIQLLDTSLLRHRDVWRQTISKMRSVIDAVAKAVRTMGNLSMFIIFLISLGTLFQVGDESLAKLWRRHWDAQLAKALDVQYRAGESF